VSGCGIGVESVVSEPASENVLDREAAGVLKNSHRIRQVGDKFSGKVAPLEKRFYGFMQLVKLLPR
jgi:hypothetical protein